jgi:hypothetical protein
MVVSAAPLQVRVSVLPVQIKIRTHFWIAWAKVAIDHEAVARRERDAAEQVAQSESHQRAVYLEREWHAAMVAVCAAAFAVDALYGAVCDLVGILPEQPEERRGRRGQILETLKRGFIIGKVATAWNKELKWLLGLRDTAVHFGEGSRDPVPHPLGMSTAPELANYSVENAERAVSFALQMLDTCTRSPRLANTDSPEFRDAEQARRWMKDIQRDEQRIQWAKNMQSAVRELLERRAELREAKNPTP